MMNIGLVNQSFNRLFEKALDPERSKDIQDLLKLSQELANDYEKHANLTNEEKALLAKHDLKVYSVPSAGWMNYYIVPNSYDETKHQPTRKFAIDYSIKNAYITNPFTGSNNPNIDLIDYVHKRCEREDPRWNRSTHSSNRTSDEFDHLKKVINQHPDKDSRSYKLFRNRFNKERDLLRRTRQIMNYNTYRRDLDDENMSKDVKEFKNLKHSLSHFQNVQKELDKDRLDARKKYLDELEQIRRLLDRNINKETEVQDKINKLLRK